MKNNIYFAFFDNLIEYDCKICQGVCCNVNNIMLLDKNSANIIKKDEKFSLISDFVTTKDDNSYLSCGKSCWFHTENGCSAARRGINKPLTCLLYPLKLRKIMNTYVVSYQPCPTYDLKYNGKKTIKYSEVEDIICEYILTGVPVANSKVNISKQRFYFELDYQEKLKNRIDFSLCSDRELKALIYYLDLRWGNIPLSLTCSQAANLFDTYMKIYCKVENMVGKFNENNKYLVLTNEFYKEISRIGKLSIVK
ncbi:hypothetical protein [Streptococcus equinus]|uniref:hypothetical protein n=1 Tax=Streptococcus equinus TaxID=1335 RepID=UPI0008F2001D|nr:hypothetical protein [Streptococcus equinus]SFQ58440.1 hypothetical protein SAMN05216422_0334 [Streptococcus equinus]